MAPEARLDFSGRVVVVTGAGSGLGREYARQLARRGARVVVNGRTEAKVLGTVEAIRREGGEALDCVVDLAQEDAAERVITRALGEWGRLDALVNNAGAGLAGSPDSFSRQDLARELAVSLHASVALSLAAWPELVRSQAGRVVNTSSSTVFGTPGSIPYASAKAAVLGLTRALALDGAPTGIRVNAVMPLALTQMNDALPNREITRQFREHFPVEKAAALVLLLAHERAPTSGETFVTGGGFSARVSLVMGAGAVPDESGPEGILAHLDDLMSLDEAFVPDTSDDVRKAIIERLAGTPDESPGG